MRHEIIVQVENIDVCRYFYREILQIGPMILDSNSHVVFTVDENCDLVLEKNTGKYLEHASGAVHFAFHCNDIQALEERLKKDGLPLSDRFERLGKVYRRGSDPEGNVFYMF